MSSSLSPLPIFLSLNLWNSGTLSRDLDRYYSCGITGDDSSASYIHMVHHLIEECLLFSMRREECMEALSKHASIPPIVTSTVWKELEKENKEFFEAYNAQKKGSPEVHGRFASASLDDHHHQMEASQRIPRMLSDSSKK